MNLEIKQKILNNEIKLLNHFKKYKQSINQFIKKIESIKYDGILYDFIIRSFNSNAKFDQENEYNMCGFKSSRQLINENKGFLNLNDRPEINKLVENEIYSPLEICSLADNYNNQVGMYFLTGSNSVIIKSTVEDNDRPYDDKWLMDNIILRYYMQSESDSSVESLIFSHKPNSEIFNALMKHEEINIYVFINNCKNTPYKYMGIYHPCGLVSKNKAFILYKHGFESEIPLDNLEGKYLMPLLKNGYLKSEFNIYLSIGSEDATIDNSIVTIKKSKRNEIQQKKIDMEVALRGEELVLNYEKNRLIKMGYLELAEKVENVTLINSELGYDIKSFEINKDGSVKDVFIKVKTFVNNRNTSFTLMANELDGILTNDYKLYKVYDVYTNYPKFINISQDIIHYKKDNVMYGFSR